MKTIRRRLFSRQRLVKAVAVFVIAVFLFWFFGRFAVARWIAVQTFASIGLQPVSFDVASVTLRSVELKNVAFGEPTWFTTDNVTVNFTIGDLFAKRVSNIDINHATWTLRSANGEVDWGYAPPAHENAGKEPLSLDLPFDRIDLRNFTVQYVADGSSREFPVTMSLNNGGRESLDGRITLTALGWTGEFAIAARNSIDDLAVELDGAAEQLDAAQPEKLTLAATLLRRHADAAMRVEGTLALRSFEQQFTKATIALAQMNLTASAQIAGDASIENINALLTATKVQINGQSITQLELSAATPDDAEKYSLKNLPLVLDFAASGDGWNMPAAAGKLNIRNQPDAMVFTIGMSTTQPVSFERKAANIEATLQSLAAGMTITRENTQTHITDGRFSMTKGTIRAGDLTISDARLQATMLNENEINVILLDAIIGEGSSISAAPLKFNPSAPVLASRITIKNLTLEQWLPIMTGEHATGEGRVSGYLDIAADFTGENPRITQLNGFLSADPEHGFIQVADAEAVGELLEKQDPRFATDEVMKPVRDKIVAALHDFSFNKLSVDFSREGDVTSALAYLSGHGRHGEDPQGVNLTLDLEAEDAFLNAYLRLADRFSIKRQAQDALDDFFSGLDEPVETSSEETEQ